MSAYAVSARGLVSRRIPQGVLAPMNALLFGSGQQGAWYDPSDLTTLFQDSAGTTPVTAVEQPVGKMLDLSGNGNHASQATTTKRGVVSRRVNLLAANNDSAWAKTTGVSSSVSGVGEVHSGSNVLKLSYNGSGNVNTYRAYVGGTISASGAQYSTFVYLRADAPVTVRISGNNIAGLLTTVNVTTSWQKFSISGTGNGVSVIQFLIYSALDNNDPFEVYLSSADTRLSIDAHLPYQWVNTSNDYDDNAFKFPTYLKSDGIDDSYSSATGGGGNAGFFFSACVSRMAATNGVLFSDIALAPPYNGYYLRISAGGNAVFAAYVNNVASQVIGPALQLGAPSIVQAWDDGVNLNVRVDGSAVFSTPRPAMAAGSSGFTMGQDNGTSTGYFNGRIYSTVYRKDSAPTQVQREAVAALQRLKARMP